MTSIEWFIKEIEKHDKDFSSFYGAEITQAKQMHEEELIDAYNKGALVSVALYNENYKK